MKNLTRKIGFFAALSISISTVIGIGIFFKNTSVLKNQIFNSNFGYFSFWSFIAAWIVGGMVALFTAYSFSQISKAKDSKSGLAAWVEVLGGKKQGFIVKVLHCTFYYALINIVLPVISCEMLFAAIAEYKGISLSDIHIGYVVLTGIIIWIIFSLINYFAINFSAKIQTFAFFFKLIPLFAAVVISFITTGTKGMNVDQINPGAIGIAKMNYFNLSGLFISLPAILFSFDAFLSIGNMAKDVKKPSWIPLISILTIVIAAILYVFISIGVGLTGYGSIGQIFESIVPKANVNLKKTLKILTYLTIALGGFFVVNSISMVSLRSAQGLVEQKQIIFYKQLNSLNKYKKDLGGLVLYFILALFYFILLIVPSIIVNGDSLLDTATNIPVLTFFMIYAYTMLLALIDKFKNPKKPVIKFFVPITIIAIVAIMVIMGYELFYKDIYLLITNANKISGSGILYANNQWLIKYDVYIFWSLIGLMMLWILANYWILKQQLAKENLTFDQVGENLEI